MFIDKQKIWSQAGPQSGRITGNAGVPCVAQWREKVEERGKRYAHC